MKDYFRRNYDVNIHFVSKKDLLNFNIDKGTAIIKSDKSIFCKTKRVMAADPFIIKEKDIYYIFFEDLADYIKPAVLKMQYSSDLKHWSSPKIVLKENFHLSFPSIIKEDGKYYMVPETVGGRSVRLYQADPDSLDHWNLKCILINNKKYCDSSIFKYNGVFYLFATVDVNIYEKQQYELHLYTSTHIEGPYEKHPQSPICVGNRYGRNGGNILNIDGRLFRPAQDCVKEYGVQLNMMEITKLSPTEYSEKVVKQNILTRPGHHLSMVDEEVDGNYIVCTDSKVLSLNLYMSMERILVKLSNVFPVLQRFLKIKQ